MAPARELDDGSRPPLPPRGERPAAGPDEAGTPPPAPRRASPPSGGSLPGPVQPHLGSRLRTDGARPRSRAGLSGKDRGVEDLGRGRRHQRPAVDRGHPDLRSSPDTGAGDDLGLLTGIVDTDSHIFWITSRAAGITALVLASLSLGLGLAVSMRRERAGGNSVVDYRNLHEVLSLLTLSMVALHGLSLLGDSFLRPGSVESRFRSRRRTAPSGRGSGSSPATAWRPSGSPTTPVPESGWHAGESCTRSPRSSGSSGSSTRSERAPTPGRRGSCCWSGRPCCPPPACWWCEPRGEGPGGETSALG